MPPRPLNILFFLPDQQRPDWAGPAEGLDLRTPNLDRLRREGTAFDKAYTPSPLCAPARACLASGRAYGDCGVWNNNQDYPLGLPTYYQALRDAGYRVAGVGKFDLHKDLTKPLDWHLDGSRLLDEWGFTEGIDNEGKIDGVSSYLQAGTAKGPYLHFLQQRGLADAYAEQLTQRPGAHISVLPQDAYCDTWIADNGLRFLRGFPRGTPWHLVVNFAGPHSPFDVTAEMADSVRNRRVPPPTPASDLPEARESHEKIRRHYAAMIEHIDAQVGRFLETVEARGELDNTLVVYASDHGEMLGDHDRFGKSTWREASARIPLIVAGPGVRRGVRTDALVLLHDLAATFVDAAGTAPMPEMEARSLRALLAGETNSHRDAVTSALCRPDHGCWDMVTDGRVKLVYDDAGRHLYDLQTDPNELQEIADPDERTVERLAARRNAAVAARR
ncbi:MAG: sulfatase [Planctomycetota bacterium]